MKASRVQILLSLGLGLVLSVGLVGSNPAVPTGAARAQALGVSQAEPAALPTTPDWTAIGEVDEQAFGMSVAAAGDVNGDGYGDALVGASGHGNSRGKAFVYYGSPGGLATIPGWTATGENELDHFGEVVAGAGDVNGDGYADVMVAAYWYPSGGERGKVYVYHGGPAGLSPTPNWTAEGGEPWDQLGVSLGTAGDVNGDGYADVIVGAQGDGSWRGSAYVYHGGPAGLNPTPDWTVAGEGASDQFGSAVSTAGDVNGDGYADVVVATWFYGSASGKAYVYHGGAGGLSLSPDWTATGPQAQHRFGESVANAGDVNGDGYGDLLVGATTWDAERRGVVYLFRGSASGLELSAAQTLLGEHNEDQFGWSVATLGDSNGDGYADIVVGAGAWLVGSWHGRAYVYQGGLTGLNPIYTWSRGGEFAVDNYGWSVSTAGDINGDGYADLIVGANAFDGPGSNRGKAYAYYGAVNSIGSSPVWAVEGDNGADYYGASAAAAGDVNGDGYSDLIVGAHGYDGGGTDRGAVFLYLGGSAGLSLTPVWTKVGADNEHLGAFVAAAGDVDGDGLGDVAVADFSNQVFVYHGNLGGLDAEPTWTGSGSRMAGVGDVDGDGYADLLVSTSSEQLHLYPGSPEGLSPTPIWTAGGEHSGDAFGSSFGSAGDVNGDSYADVIAGAPLYGGAGIDRGKAYLYTGSPAGLSLTPSWTVIGGADHEYLGTSVSTAGDVNGDGYADLVIGAFGHNIELGKAYAFHGGPTGPGPSPAWVVEGANHGDEFGARVSTAGDVNADGYSDVIVGAPNYSGGYGKAYVFFGSSAGLETSDGWSSFGTVSTDYYAFVVGSAGDVEGDGYGGILFNAWGYDGYRGKVFVYQGNGGGGRRVVARQVRGDDSERPVQPWGLSYGVGRFEVSMHGTNPLGRSRVKLQIEACPTGVPFGDATCRTHTSAAWRDTTPTPWGYSLYELVAGLQGGTLFRWRARLLWAPFGVNQPGITAPPNPEHGPWRRLLGVWQEADVRVSPYTIYLPLVTRNCGAFGSRCMDSLGE